MIGSQRDDERAMLTLDDDDLRNLLWVTRCARDQASDVGAHDDAAEANDFCSRLRVQLDRREADATTLEGCSADLYGVSVVAERPLG